METKHTPGPWTAEWCRPDKAKGHTFEPRCWISGITPEYGSVRLADIPDPVDDNAEANARLIAAAPDMLEEAKKNDAIFLDLLTYFVKLALYFKETGNDDLQRLQSELGKAISVRKALNRAAIARAEGRE